MAAARRAAERSGGGGRHRSSEPRRRRGVGEPLAVRRRRCPCRALLRRQGRRRGRSDRHHRAAAEVAMVETLTRSRVEGWSSGHLRQAAMGWQRQADLTEQTYTRAQHAVDAVPWSGAGADGARVKLAENLAKIRGALALLERAGKIATAG